MEENKKIIIAIDGYSSTGKSSFAKGIAAKLGYLYVDTGALYRAITYYAYTNGFIDNKNKVKSTWLSTTLPAMDISFAIGDDGKSYTQLNGINIEKQIRSMEVSSKVSHISKHPFVRAYVNKILHKLGADKGVVMDGRDIGTMVFPNAELKLFMTADIEIRAARRYEELKAKGSKESMGSILENLIERDNIDQNRKFAPLAKASDAIVLDNSHMSIPEQYIWLGKILKEKFDISFKQDESKG